MPAQELRFLPHFAVLWTFSGYEGEGQVTVNGTPVQVPCRWNDVRTEQLQSDGNVISYDATVVVAQNVHTGSIMWLGTLEDYYGTGTGTGTNPPSDLFEVKTANWTADIKGRAAFRQLQLMRFRSTLPTTT